jgi:DNA adenine methylase
MNLINEPIATYNQTGLEFANYTEAKKLLPLLKWAGGKEQELKYIIPNLTNKFQDYYEPFVGGGSLYSSSSINYFIKVC